ncbi:hypothetical protein ACVWWG_007477 [Bradyrhizobium sp. LB7.2]
MEPTCITFAPRWVEQVEHMSWTPAGYLLRSMGGAQNRSAILAALPQARADFFFARCVLSILYRLVHIIAVKKARDIWSRAAL